MMSAVMHLNAVKGSPQGGVRTMCGTWLRLGEGAPADAPVCSSCMKEAGWPDDLRRTGRSVRRWLRRRR